MAESQAQRADVVRGISWVAASHVVGQVAWFGSLFAIAALVDPSDFGSVTVAMVLVQVAWLLVGSGTRGAFVVTPQLTAAQVRRATMLNAGAGLAIGGGIALLAAPIGHVIAPGANIAVLRVLALSVSLFGLSIVPLALLQKELLFKRHAAVTATAAIVSSVVAVAAALLGADIWALVARQVLFQMLLAALGWIAVRGVRPRSDARPAAGRSAARPPDAKWFFLLAIVSFAALNVDYVIVGRFTDVTQLGLYSLAFTIAFAPVTQFAWQIGKVLFPAAARTAAADVAGRAAKAVRIAGLVLLPSIAPAIVLAPVLLPQVLGARWEPMVVPFQLLWAVGVIHAVLAILREFLLGTGNVRLCVPIDFVWLLGVAAALAVLVNLDGMRGAAVAHIVMAVPYAAAYIHYGLPRLGLRPRRLAAALAEILGAVGAQGATTAILAFGLPLLGVPSLLSACLAAAGGLAALGALLLHRSDGALSEASAMLSGARRRPPAPAS
jgi:O-antigen/teichoic acid export membrane protein